MCVAKLVNDATRALELCIFTKYKTILPLKNEKSMYQRKANMMSEMEEQTIVLFRCIKKCSERTDPGFSLSKSSFKTGGCLSIL